MQSTRATAAVSQSHPRSHFNAQITNFLNAIRTCDRLGDDQPYRIFAMRDLAVAALPLADDRLRGFAEAISGAVATTLPTIGGCITFAIGNEHGRVVYVEIAGEDLPGDDRERAAVQHQIKSAFAAIATHYDVSVLVQAMAEPDYVFRSQFFWQ